jgi:RNA polymerase sigma-70 factor (ECF subfamily)
MPLLGSEPISGAAVNQSAEPSATNTLRNLESITTNWAILRDPQQFVLRYGVAIRAYVVTLLGNSADSEEVLQDFLVRIIAQGGFLSADPARGRFRDYLRTCLHNAAISHLRRKPPRGVCLDAVEDLAIDDSAQRAAETAWLNHWRQCLLDKAWRELDRFQQRSSGNQYHTVLRAAVEHREEDSVALANRVARSSGRPVSPEAYRKQLSRARRVFAQALLAEVADTLDQTDAQAVEQELIDVGLWEYMRDLLPADWPNLLRGRMQ